MCDLDKALKEADNSRKRYIVDNNGLDQVGDEEDNYVLLKVGDTFYPNSFRATTVPDDWVEPPHNETKVKPPFTEVDNPEGFSSFEF